MWWFSNWTPFTVGNPDLLQVTNYIQLYCAQYTIVWVKKWWEYYWPFGWYDTFYEHQAVWNCLNLFTFCKSRKYSILDKKYTKVVVKISKLFSCFLAFLSLLILIRTCETYISYLIHLWHTSWWRKSLKICKKN